METYTGEHLADLKMPDQWGSLTAGEAAEVLDLDDPQTQRPKTWEALKVDEDLPGCSERVMRAAAKVIANRRAAEEIAAMRQTGQRGLTYSGLLQAMGAV